MALEFREKELKESFTERDLLMYNEYLTLLLKDSGIHSFLLVLSDDDRITPFENAKVSYSSVSSSEAISPIFDRDHLNWHKIHRKLKINSLLDE